MWFHGRRHCGREGQQGGKNQALLLGAIVLIGMKYEL